MESEANFPAECLEDVFSHLKGKDLLECTLVCPEWNSFIGSTKKCMEKICLNCGSNYRYLFERILMNSGRKYACLKLDIADKFLEILRNFQFSIQKLDLGYKTNVQSDCEPEFESSGLQFP